MKFTSTETTVAEPSPVVTPQCVLQYVLRSPVCWFVACLCDCVFVCVFLWRVLQKLLPATHDLNELGSVRCILGTTEMGGGGGLDRAWRGPRGAQWLLPSSNDSTPESQALAANFSCLLLMISCSSEPEPRSRAAFWTVTWL